MTSFRLVRHIEARLQVVFDAVTTATGIAQWWGPDAGPVLLAEADRRVGGRYRVRFRTLRGTEHESSGEFLEIDPPKRVVMSCHWKGGVVDPGESRIEFRLRATPEGTDLSFMHSPIYDDATSRSDEQGWAWSLRKLEAYLAKGEAA
jgi:uncharacterized protein YndB with AHSA1/START domain